MLNQMVLFLGKKLTKKAFLASNKLKIKKK